MTILSARAGLAAVAVAALLAVAGCAESRVAESASFNEADLQFVEQMIPHHQQAVQISELAGKRSQDEQISSLASDISFIQTIELEELQGVLLDWGFAETTDDHEDHGDMSGMLTEAELQQLETATGSDFDLTFAQLMLKHHEGAIAAAEKALKDGKSEYVQFFAQSLLQTQGAEIIELQSIIDRLTTVEGETE